MYEIPADRLLKASEVARILQISKTQVYRLMSSELPTVRFGGGTVRVRPDDLEKYIAAHVDQRGRKNDDRND